MRYDSTRLRCLQTNWDNGLGRLWMADRLRFSPECFVWWWTTLMLCMFGVGRLMVHRGVPIRPLDSCACFLAEKLSRSVHVPVGKRANASCVYRTYRIVQHTILTVEIKHFASWWQLCNKYVMLCNPWEETQQWRKHLGWGKTTTHSINNQPCNYLLSTYAKSKQDYAWYIHHEMNQNWMDNFLSSCNYSICLIQPASA